MAESAEVSDNTEIFKQLESYPWDKDKEFQGGLSAILGPNPSPSQLEDLTIRAQCFYLSRKKSVPIDFDAYKAYLASKNTHETTTTTSPPSSENQNIPQQPEPSDPAAAGATAETSLPSKEAPYPQTFAQIIELISTNAPIPGIRDIPDTVLPDQATAPKAAVRRKPWEKEGSEDVKIGTFGDARDEKPIVQELPEEDGVASA